MLCCAVLCCAVRYRVPSAARCHRCVACALRGRYVFGCDAGGCFPPNSSDWICIGIEVLFYVLVALKLLRERRKRCRQGLFTWVKMVPHSIA